MYNQEFWDRVSLQQLCYFILTGAERVEDPGTFAERYQRNSKDFMVGLHRFRERVLAADWDALGDEKAREGRDEDLCAESLFASANLEYLSFEVGVAAGLMLGRQMADNLAE